MIFLPRLFRMCSHRAPAVILALTLEAGAAFGSGDAGEVARAAQRLSAARQATAGGSMHPSIARQTAAVAAVAAALAVQRDSIALQSRVAGAGGFGRERPALSAAPCDPIPAAVLDPLIRDEAARQQLSSELIRAVIEQESAFRPCAVSPKGAMGLMQLMPATATWLGVVNPFDARENIASGARLLRMLLERYGGQLEKALAAYNAGPARVDEAGGIPPIAETQQYVPRILNRLKP